MLEIAATTTDPTAIHAELAAYQTAMTRHCPYLRPSMQRGLTTWSAVEVQLGDSPQLLGLLVEHAERLRATRRENGPLVCHNIAMYGPVDIPEARAVMDWPAWIIRNLYAPVQVMIGRFWIGEQRYDKNEHPITGPPISFFSLRHSFTTRDRRFLATFPIVAGRLADAADDGRDVLLPWLGTPTSAHAANAGYSRLVTLFPAEAKATT